jgi:KUP system potassium uptake protein
VSAPGGQAGPPTGKRLAALSFAALGVVYGDIGTSPLYALKECFAPHRGMAVTPENIYGVLSLIFWALAFLIAFKYLVVMLRADNRGEGGILALLALVKPNEVTSRGKWLLVSAGLFGSALLYGDGIITPAISVLGAVEGLAVAAPRLEPLVMWIALAIIIALFLVQRRGTAGVGAIFGPVTLVWFTCIGLLGVTGILREPGVLAALNPWHAVEFFGRHGLAGITILAAVVLVVTGGEALYADMGHFGKRPIRLAWFGLVMPALVLNYFGQGALLISDPSLVNNPFYNLVPAWGLYPMIGLATMAAITASQALISGSFSLTQQALQLGYTPRVTIVHTSHREKGQIYIPEVNWALMVACVGLVLTFQSAGNLADTYGVAIMGTMLTTTVLFAAVARERWRWPVGRIALLVVPMLSVEAAFFVANLTKIPTGGWFPLAVAGLVFVVMSTWKRGRRILMAKLRDVALPIEMFVADVANRKPPRVPGTAVFMTSDPAGAPPVLLHHLKHNKVLHERVLLMSVVTEEVPQVPEEERLELRELGEGFWSVVASYGFMQTPNMPKILEALKARGLPLTMMDTSFYLGRETLIAARGRPRTGSAADLLSRRMPYWRKKLFVLLTNNARSATAYFGLPPNRVVELGAQIQF